MKYEQGYTDGGANPHYDGLFDGETDADKERRIQWAINEDQLPWPGMMTAFENYYGQSWFDRDWRDETAIWAAAWKAAKTHNNQAKGPGFQPGPVERSGTNLSALLGATTGD